MSTIPQVGSLPAATLARTARGFSLGGPIAIRAAARHPDRVTALVLTASFAHADTRLRLAASIWRELHEAGNQLLLASFLALSAFSPAYLEALAPGQLEAAVEVLAGAVPPGTPEHTDLIGRIDVRRDLAGIRSPTLVISTTADPLVSPDLHRQLADGIPGAQLAEIESGHLPMAERPEQWGQLIAAFLAEHHPATGHFAASVAEHHPATGPSPPRQIGGSAMRAVTQHSFGGPEVLEITEAAMPVPLPSEVLVRIRASAVNPVDAMARSGALPLLGEPPFVLGWDISGVVEQVVPGVNRFARRR